MAVIKQMDIVAEEIATDVIDNIKHTTHEGGQANKQWGSFTKAT